MTFSVSATPGKLAYSIPEAAEQLGLGERTVWRLIETGEIRAVRVGRRVIIPAATLSEFLERNQVPA